MSTEPALTAVKVVEFGGYAAGPHIGKILANFGATVVHVESKSRPDGFRLQYPPFKDGIPGPNRGGCFGFFNDSKYGVTVDLKNPKGLELARRLTDWADIVIENMRPGVMQRVGLGYEEISKNNPKLVMLSTCNMGQTGPRAHTPGFGSQLSSLAGFCDAIGESDGPPMLLYGPYIDFIASVMGCCAALAALDQRRRSGKGSFIDISQYECGLHFMAGALLGYHRDDTIARRDGNRDDRAVPHGAYQCRDGRWLALSCWSDAEFAALLEVLDQPEAIEDRHGDVQALDDWLAQELIGRDADETAEALQQEGVRAYPVNTVADLFTDPQLVARRTWRRRKHEEIGEQTYLMPGFDLKSSPGEISRAAPLLGGDNETVFRDFLGLDKSEFDSYAAEGVFS
jgi:crotonobetainyl-CoA:carnitine CoA-transferase CaiB-like acyl-CoA transferase